MNADTIKKCIVEEIILVIENELEKSSSTQYICEDDSIISTDVGYIEDWFKEYKYILREKYCK